MNRRLGLKPMNVYSASPVLASMALTLVFSAPEIVRAQAVPGHTATAREAYGPLFKDSRAQLALELARGRDEVRLIIASDPGRNPEVVAAVEAMGGRIDYREDTVDYLRITVPITNVQQVVNLDGIAAVSISLRSADLPALLLSAEGDRRGSPTSRLGISSRAASDTLPEEWPPRRTDLPLRHPYSPLEDIDASGFGPAESPFDGRGVTVAVVDAIPDLLLPELQWAVTLDGRVVRKIADVVNATDPRDPLPDRQTPQWVEMREKTVATRDSLTFGGTRYTAPRDGSFRIGLLNERLFGAPLMGFGAVDGDLNRDSNPPGSDSLFAVLWDTETGEVWVDTQQNHSFADNLAMLEYGLRHDVGVLGEDDPTTEVRESVGFTILTDPAAGFVSVNVGVGVHGTMTAGAVVASRRGGGRMDGIAPGARLVMVDRGRTLHGEIEAVIAAFRHPATDLVVLEQGIDPAYLPKDGGSTPSVIYDRLVHLYDKPLLVPASNRPGLTSVATQAEGRRAIAVNAYQSQASFLINNGIRVAQSDNLHSAHSHGPGGDGRLKPDVLAPSRIISIQPAFIQGGAMDGLYRLPPGYFVGGGTSTAAPVAAGALARLMSAAKQSEVEYDAAVLRRALTQSARFIPSIAAHKQGHGLVQVAAAWALLTDTAFHDDPVRIVSRAPVRTAVSGWLTPAHEGEGIFEREGWSAGETAVRRIRLTRLTGPPEPLVLHARWLGNQGGTFTSEDSLVLPRGREVVFPVTVTPEGMGVQSAILSLEDAQGRSVHRIMNTVVVPHTFDPNTHTLDLSALLPRPGVRSFFLRVPPGTPALHVEVTGPPGWDLWFYPPDARDQLIFARYAESRRRGVSQPAAGVWEVTLTHNRDDWEFDESRPDPLPPTPITLQAKLLGTEIIGLDGWGPRARNASGDEGLELIARNAYAEFNGGLTSAPLGSALAERRAIAHGEQQVYSIDVPIGSTMLRVHAGRAADPDADLDLYLFDCSGELCLPRHSASENGFDEPVFVIDPAAGEWRVVVDAASVPAGTTAYDYLEAVFHPVFGTAAVSDVAIPRGPGDEWSVAANVWIACVPAAGRVPYVRIPVRGEGVEEQFRVARMDPFDHRIQPLEIGAAGAILRPGRLTPATPECET